MILSTFFTMLSVTQARHHRWWCRWWVGDQYMNRKLPSGSHCVSSLNSGLSRPPVPLKIKEMYVESIWTFTKVVHVLVLCFSWPVALENSQWLAHVSRNPLVKSNLKSEAGLCRVLVCYPFMVKSDLHWCVRRLTIIYQKNWSQLLYNSYITAVRE